MLQIRRLLITMGILTCLLHVQGASKYYTDDENRPYEFGFNIEGEQHRHEKKDENGLIMGEFGFITADNVYHVTVYATDENGNFKILSMKNIRLKPVQEKKAKELPLPPVPQDQPQQPGPGLPVRTCSHCSIPTSTPNPQLNDIAAVAQDPQYNYPQENYPEQNYPNQDYPPEEPLQSGERNPKLYNDYPAQYDQNPEKPVLVSAQMQIVDKNTDIYSRGPGEREGLPPGLTKGDMQQLLYTFNYTVGFHGHHEEGYRNGAKKGYYYITGRNGVRTRVDYEADENGFRPKITQEVLDLISEEVPKEETEKDAKYGLKGYEFKWLYYPVDSKRR